MQNYAFVLCCINLLICSAEIKQLRCKFSKISLSVSSLIVFIFVFLLINGNSANLNKTEISGLYYKHMMIINYASSIVNKLGASLTDDARVVFYDRHVFIVQATVLFVIVNDHYWYLKIVKFVYQFLSLFCTFLSFTHQSNSAN